MFWLKVVVELVLIINNIFISCLKFRIDLGKLEICSNIDCSKRIIFCYD